MRRIVRQLLLLLFSVLPVSSPICAETPVEDLVRQFKAFDFKGLDSALRAVISDTTVDADGRTAVRDTIDGFAAALAPSTTSADENRVVLEKWIAETKSFESLLITATFYIDYAWLDRGTSYARLVAPNAWPVFDQRIQKSREYFLAAEKANPKSVEPYIGELRICRTYNRSLCGGLLAAGRTIDENRIDLFEPMLAAKMLKWGGGDEESLAFARDEMKRHPKNPEFGYLLLTAHLEIARRGKEDDLFINYGEYWRQEEVMTEARAAVDAITAAYPRSPLAHNWSARLSYAKKDFTAMAGSFSKVAGACDARVWNDGLCAYAKSKIPSNPA